MDIGRHPPVVLSMAVNLTLPPPVRTVPGSVCTNLKTFALVARRLLKALQLTKRPTILFGALLEESYPMHPLVASGYLL